MLSLGLPESLTLPTWDRPRRSQLPRKGARKRPKLEAFNDITLIQRRQGGFQLLYAVFQ